MQEKPLITISVLVARPPDQVWASWSQPEHVVHWNAASDDWHCPHAETEFYPGGQFNYRMEARDGSFGFDFRGAFSAIEEHRLISYTLEDSRTVSIRFTPDAEGTRIEETFEAEQENPVELQRTGWQMILNRFKEYCESLA